MQVTLSIDDALLEAARPLAEARQVDLGEVITEWAQRGRSVENAVVTGPNGFPMFPARGRPITSQQVADLLADEGLLAGR